MNSIATILLTLTIPASAQPAPNALEDYSNHVQAADACADRVTIGLSQSLTLPALTPKGLRYRQFYFATRTPEGGDQWLDEEVYAPSVAVQFQFNNLKELDCDLQVPMPHYDLGKPLGKELSAAQRKISHHDWLTKVRRYYVVLDSLSSGIEKAKPDTDTLRSAKEFRELFKALSEPPLQAHYRALSPGFWKWLDGLEKTKGPKRP